jgi:NADPH:quinone reductase-like Zn-dependent oxidoreductase
MKSSRLAGTSELARDACTSICPDSRPHRASRSCALTCPKSGYTREELPSRASDLFGWTAAGRLMVRIGGTYPLQEAARAHADLEGRHTTGKLLLVPG